VNARRDHPWDVRPGEAFRIQRELRSKVILENGFDRIDRIAGADVSISLDDGRVFAAVVVMRFDTVEVVEVATASAPLSFPYIPGLLTFREGPVVLKALSVLKQDPDLMIFDGQGIAHPRGLGLASHMGVLLDIPTIGCAKSRLVGKYRMPGSLKGMQADLISEDGGIIGTVLRTRDDVRPVFVSPGHRVAIRSAPQIVLTCCRRYRLPEPTRIAHIEVGRAKAREKGDDV